MTLTVANVLSMTIEFWDQPDAYTLFLQVLNYVFCVIFLYELVAKTMSPRQRSVLHVSKQLHGEKVPKKLAMKAADAFTTIESLCAGSGTGTHAAAMDRYRKRADQK